MTLLEAISSYDLAVRGLPRNVNREQQIRECALQLSWEMPMDYCELMRECDGFECYFPNGRCVDMWPMSELVQRNGEAEIDLDAPELIMIGSTLSNGAIVANRRLFRYAIVPYDSLRWSLADIETGALSEIVAFQRNWAVD